METNEQNRREEVNALKSIAYRACQNTSFSPEKRGEMFLNDLECMLQEFLSQVPDEFKVEYQTKLISLYSNWLSAKSRCASTMITGGSNFPVRRNEKYNRWEQSAWSKVVEWRDKVLKRLNRQERLTGWAEIERLQEKVDQYTKAHEMMKQTNVTLKKKLSDEDMLDALIDIGLNENAAKDLLTPDYRGRRGYASFSLTNNLATIKSTQARLDRLTREQNTETKEYEIGGIKVEENYADNRIRLYFNGKPSEEVRTKLKKNGFKWSPRAGAWQNYINRNSLEFVKTLI